MRMRYLRKREEKNNKEGVLKNFEKKEKKTRLFKILLFYFLGQMHRVQTPSPRSFYLCACFKLRNKNDEKMLSLAFSFLLLLGVFYFQF